MSTVTVDRMLSAVAIPADDSFRAAMMDGLVWLPEYGMGFCGEALRTGSAPYDRSYWAKYEEYARTELGRRLNEIRLDVVRRHVPERSVICDIGIGCGAFVEAQPGALGYDVNPVGIEWLQERGLWCDPYLVEVDAITCWDSLEHVAQPAALLRNVRHYVIASLPIFYDARDVLASKHYRRDEHVWYWTRDGLIRWMDAQGFDILEHGTPESIAGREAIHTFVFRRR